MDVALVVRDVKKRRRTREAVGWNWTSRKGGQRIMYWKVHVVWDVLVAVSHWHVLASCVLEKILWESASPAGRCRMKCPSRSISPANPAITFFKSEGISTTRFGEHVARSRPSESF
jgi:hypothetical protein